LHLVHKWTILDKIFLPCPLHRMKKKTIVMAWGGTWWHVFPIKSLIETIISDSKYSDQVKEIIRFWSKNSLEQETAAKFWDKVKFISILSWKWRRETPLKSRLKNIRDLFLFAAGFIQSTFYLRKSKADVVFCKWWYVALPVVFAAKFLWKPIFVHESDVKPWLVNRIWNKFSKQSFCGFDNVFSWAIVVGQILSDEIVPDKNTNPELTNSLKSEKKDGKPSILVMWWSQGSKKLYECLADLLKENEILRESFHYHIILGKLNEDLKQIFSEFSSVTTYDFLSQSDMWILYQHCDISLTRGWTTSLAEQKLFNLKSIIVPIPRTHDQKLNAERYVKKFNDIMVEQSKETTSEDLLNALVSLKDYHKPEISTDIHAEIWKAKHTILDHLLK